MLSLAHLKENMLVMKPYLVSKYAISQLYIFGSYAREEQTDKSDIDLLVDFKKTPDLLTFLEIEEYMSKQLHVDVDLVPKRKLKKQLKEQILSEAIKI
ncbi:MAG: nucleotidyltransferase family protein [Campylobacterota bacterium]|nr:nucleotidyltransferase family protein [Campylobacterota bacterium]